MKTEKLFFLCVRGSKKVFTEKDDFFECILKIFIFLNNMYGLIDIGLVVGLGFDKFVKVETIGGKIIGHEIWWGENNERVNGIIKKGSRVIYGLKDYIWRWVLEIKWAMGL